MKVRYRTVWPVLILVLAPIIVLAGIFNPSLIQLVIGVLFILFGILALVRECFEFDPATQTLAVKPLIGPARQFGGTQGGRLEVEAGRIVWVRPDGRRKNVPVHRFQVNGAEWDAVLDRIAA